MSKKDGRTNPVGKQLDELEKELKKIQRAIKIEGDRQQSGGAHNPIAKIFLNQKNPIPKKR